MEGERCVAMEEERCLIEEEIPCTPCTPLQKELPIQKDKAGGPPIRIEKYGVTLFKKDGKDGDSPQVASFALASEQGREIMFVLEEIAWVDPATGKKYTRRLYGSAKDLRDLYKIHGSIPASDACTLSIGAIRPQSTASCTLI